MSFVHRVALVLHVCGSTPVQAVEQDEEENVERHVSPSCLSRAQRLHFLLLSLN